MASAPSNATVASASAGGDGARLADGTRLGAVHLTVTDLARSVSFYENVIGLRAQSVDGGVVVLGAGGDEVLVLHEDPAAAAAGRHPGLYHVALLYPSRLELARAGLRVAAARVPIDGASDHRTHEAIYLPDPDGIGLELAADRPRSAWPTMEAAYAGGPQPLDQHGLFALVEGEQPTVPAADGLAVGHVHLHVGDVGEGLAFYRDVLGFDLVINLGSAAFVSAGGYHHHVAFNTWGGASTGTQPDGVVGLRHWTLVVDGPAELAAVRARLTSAGVPVDEVDGGLLARDRAGLAVLIRT